MRHVWLGLVAVVWLGLVALGLAVTPAWAAFPTVAATTGGTQTTPTTTHTVNLPAGVTNGDLLVVIFGTDIAPVVTWPSGWTVIVSTNHAGFLQTEVASRFADGTEGATITVTTDAAVPSAHNSYRITGHDAATAPQGAIVDGVDDLPDPPALTPAWGSADTLWLAVTNKGDAALTGYPANYTNGTDFSITGGHGVASARRARTAASENPGPFTLAATAGWVAATVGVRPSPVAAGVPNQLPLRGAGR